MSSSVRRYRRPIGSEFVDTRIDGRERVRKGAVSSLEFGVLPEWGRLFTARNYKPGYTTESIAVARQEM
jgi:hypothetical protein